MTLLNNIIDSMNDDGPKGTILLTMAISVGIEFCGKITSGNLGPDSSQSSFKDFIQKYMPSRYHRFDKFLYKVLRCGVLHTYLAKGFLGPSKEMDKASSHLQCCEDGLFLHIPTFIKDVQAAIRKLEADLQQNEQLRQNYENINRDLISEGQQEYRELLQREGITPSQIKFRGDIQSDI